MHGRELSTWDIADSYVGRGATCFGTGSHLDRLTLRSLQTIRPRGSAVLSMRKNRLKLVQDCRKITDHFRAIYRTYPILIKENRRLSTRNRLDLQTLGSQPVIMPKISLIIASFSSSQSGAYRAQRFLFHNNDTWVG